MTGSRGLNPIIWRPINGPIDVIIHRFDGYYHDPGGYYHDPSGYYHVPSGYYDDPWLFIQRETACFNNGTRLNKLSKCL